MSRSRAPFELPPMPEGKKLHMVDEIWSPVSPLTLFHTASVVEAWPEHLPHYRYVRFRERAADGGGLVEMSANRPFGMLQWPTWWLSEMTLDRERPAIRFRHVGGVTRGMDVEWRFHARDGGTQVELLHVWDGPSWPLISGFAAVHVIGPVFIHAIASRTLSGLARAAERAAAPHPSAGSAQ